MRQAVHPSAASTAIAASAAAPIHPIAANVPRTRATGTKAIVPAIVAATTKGTTVAYVSEGR